METHDSSRPRISVIVVSFNTVDKLRKCLTCLDSSLEVIVVDNASTDGSQEMVEHDFPWVKLIRNSTNVGFGRANNQGTRIAHGDLWLYLNSDAYAEPGAIEHLASTFDDPAVVAAGGLLLWSDGTPQLCSSNHLTLSAVFAEQLLLEKLMQRFGREGYWNTRTLLQKGGTAQTPQVMGASMMVRAGLEEFDERFFLYCEDTDLCKRLERHGRIILNPSARFVHDLGSSSKRDPWLGIARYNLGKELYFKTHHGSFAAALCWLLNRTGALLRTMIYILKSIVKFHTHPNVQVFTKVLFARKKQLLPPDWL